MKTPEERAQQILDELVYPGATDTLELRNAIVAAIREAVREATADPDAARKMAAEDLRGIVEEMRGQSPPLPYPTAFLARLLDWLAMPPLERAFVESLLANRLDDTALAVFADWLEENGQDAEGRRVRLLRPQKGDVLVVWVRDASSPSGSSGGG